MNARPTMSQAVDKAHLNELLVKYYRDLASEYDQNLGSVYLLLTENKMIAAKEECEIFIDRLDS